MNPRRQRFVDAYCGEHHGNATQSAIAAGYSAKTAYQQGHMLLRDLEVQQAVSQRLGQATQKAAMTTDRLVQRLSDIAECTPDQGFKGADVVNSLKTLADIHKLTSKHDQAAMNVQVTVGFIQQAEPPPVDITVTALPAGDEHG